MHNAFKLINIFDKAWITSLPVCSYKVVTDFDEPKNWIKRNNLGYGTRVLRCQFIHTLQDIHEISSMYRRNHYPYLCVVSFS